MKAFFLGFGFEILYLAWLHFADRGAPWRAAILSMVVGAVSLAGVATAIRDQWQGVLLILGYGAGSYVVAKWNALRTSSR